MQEGVPSPPDSNSVSFTKISLIGTVLCYLVMQTAEEGSGRKANHSAEVGPQERYLGFINRSINNTFLFLLVLLLLICNIVLWAYICRYFYYLRSLPCCIVQIAHCIHLSICLFLHASVAVLKRRCSGVIHLFYLSLDFAKCILLWIS